MTARDLQALHAGHATPAGAAPDRAPGEGRSCRGFRASGRAVSRRPPGLREESAGQTHRLLGLPADEHLGRDSAGKPVRVAGRNVVLVELLRALPQVTQSRAGNQGSEGRDDGVPEDGPGTAQIVERPPAPSRRPAGRRSKPARRTPRAASSANARSLSAWGGRTPSQPSPASCRTTPPRGPVDQRIVLGDHALELRSRVDEKVEPGPRVVEAREVL